MIIPTSFGLMTSGHTIKALNEIDFIFAKLKLWEKHLKDHEQEIKDKIKAYMGIEIKEMLDYKLIIEEDYFTAYEIHSKAIVKMFHVSLSEEE